VEFVARSQASGRGLFYGIVTDPLGEPCADAQIFEGEQVARSDELGRYRVEVVRTIAFINSNWPGQALLAALKQGVGSAIEMPAMVAGRVDLKLARFAAFAGRVVERATRRPVANACVEVRPFFESRRSALFHCETMSDERGEFGFVGIPDCEATASGSCMDRDLPRERLHQGSRGLRPRRGRGRGAAPSTRRDLRLRNA
jgi:hypothetical protein